MRLLFTSKGVLLTLGITFISLIVLSFATLILRNAENSDLRLTELASIDRIHTLSSSLERALFRSYLPLTGINLTLNNDTIVLVKDMKRSGSPNYYTPPDTTDAVILAMKTSDVFVQHMAESLTYKTTTLANPLGFIYINFLILAFYYPSYDSNLFNSIFFYVYGDDILNLSKISLGASAYNFRHFAITEPYCCFEVNSHPTLYPTNSTYELFLLGNNLSELKEINIKVRHPTRCPVINWTAIGTKRLSGDPGTGQINARLSILTETEQGFCYSDVQDNAIFNRSSEVFSQIIFLDNLTNDASTPGYNFITPYDPNMPANPSKERPTIMMYDGKSNTTSPIGNVLTLIQYDNPIRWEVMLKYSVGPMEVYSSETLTATIPNLNVTRIQRPARFK